MYLQGDTTSLTRLKEINKIKNGDNNEFSKYLENIEEKYKDKIKYKKAQKFEITDRKGNKLSLKELNGKVVVLNFWSIGCGPCVMEIPELNKLVDKYKNKDVVFIAITNDKDDNLDIFFKTHPFQYQIVNKAPQMIMEYKIFAWPQHFVINQNGEIIKKMTGAMPGITNILSKQIDKALDN